MTSDISSTSEVFRAISAGLETRTLEHSSSLGLENAELNRPFIHQTIKSLNGRAKGKTCLVVSGGPSMARQNSLERLKPAMDQFIIVAADGGMSHCLRAGIVPDYVLTVDPDRKRIVRWYGDDRLSQEKLQDDYFRRQDLDEHFAENEIAKNQAQIDRINKVGPQITSVLSTSACEDVRRRCFDSGMDVYWWNPIYDDPSEADSLTRKLFESNKVPCMNAGGNVGTAATVFASKVLQAGRVVLIGMDFSYYADTPIERTQYYDQFLDFMEEVDIKHAFKYMTNPHLGEDFYTDPAYFWYREGFLALMDFMEGSEIVNATEGGILYGEGIAWRSAAEVLKMMER